MAALLLALCAALTGCDLTPTNITDLLRPPKLTGEQQAVETALEKNVGSKYHLKYALTGKYRTAFILHDIDGDGVSEAFALYSPNNENAGTHIMVLRKVSGAWKKICDISGDGNEVNRIEFGNYDGSGKECLTVGWTSFNSTDLGLTVYKITGNTLDRLYTGSFTDMAVLDMENTGRDDILLLKLDTGGGTSQARLIAYRDGRLRETAKAPLDSTVSSYAAVTASKLGTGQNCVYVDGYKGAHSMVTELIYWKNGTLYTPFYNPENGTATSTFRNVAIESRDIDGDGRVEIPMPVELPGYEDKTYAGTLWLVRWDKYDEKSGLTPKLSTILNFTEGYYFETPSAWTAGSDIAVTIESKKNGAVWNFRQYDSKNAFGGTLLFTVYSFSQRDWKLLSGKDKYVKAAEDSNNVFAVQMAAPQKQSSKLSLQQSDVLSRIHLYSVSDD